MQIANVTGHGHVVVQVEGIQNKVDITFAGEDEPLAQVILDASTIYERVRFVGTAPHTIVRRRWLESEIENFFSTNDRGYFVLEADAGLGKTTFMADFARRYQYSCHFCELTNADRAGQEIALRSIAAQLVQRYDLEPYAQRGALPSSRDSRDLLNRLLAQAAEVTAVNARVVVVIDGLDEAHCVTGENVLGLPRRLPRGVYFVVASRPSRAELWTDVPHTPRVMRRLSARMPENLSDMGEFVTLLTSSAQIQSALTAAGADTNEFSTALLKKCGGVWIYLYCVWHELTSGTQTTRSIDSLPESLVAYYATYWQRWSTKEGWTKGYLPILSMLAAARKALTANELASWSETSLGNGELRAVLHTDWRAFLTINESSNDTTYEFHHATLREFFSGRVVLETLSVSEQEFIRNLASATECAHSSIADHFLDIWNTRGKRGTAFHSDAADDANARYGLRHLVAHLEAAHRLDDLDTLLRTESQTMTMEVIPPNRQGWLDMLLQRRRRRNVMARRNAWFMARDVVLDREGFLSDIERAMQASGRFSSDTARLGSRIHYALILSSVSHLSSAIPGPLIAQMVRTHCWAWIHAVQRLRAIPRGVTASLARLELLVLAPTDVLDSLGPDALQSEFVRLVGLADIFASYRPTMLSDFTALLRKHLAPDRYQDAMLAGVAALGEKGQAAEGKVFSLCAPVFASAVPAKFLACIRSLSEGDRVRALIDFAHCCDREGQRALLAEAVQIARRAEGWDRLTLPKALAALACVLPQSEKGTVVSEAISLLDEVSWDFAADAIGEGFWDVLEVRQRQAALRWISHNSNQWSRAHILAAIVPFAGSKRARVLRMATSALKKTRFNKGGIESLVRLLPELPERRQMGFVRRALRGEAARHGGEEFVKTVAQLSPWITTSEEREEILLRGIGEAAKLSDDVFLGRTFAFAALAPHLSPDLLSVAITRVQVINDSHDLARMRATLLDYLPQSEQEKLARRLMLELPDSGEHRANAQRLPLLALMAPHSAEARRQLLRDIRREPHWLSGIYVGPFVRKMPDDIRRVVLHEILASKAAVREASTELQNWIGALQILAPYLEGDTVNSALRIVSHLNPKYSRGSTLALLATRIRGSERRTALLHEAFATPEGECRDDGWTVALESLSQNPDSGWFDPALRVAYSCAQVGERAIALAITARFASTADRRTAVLNDALAIARSMHDGEDEAEAHVNRWKHGLSDDTALLSLGKLPYDGNRASVLANIARWFSGGEKANLLEDALTITRALESKWHRADALVAIAAGSEGEQRHALAVEGLMAAVEVVHMADRCNVLEALVPILDSMPSVQVEYALAAVLPSLARRTRPDFLSDLCALTPLLVHVGGPEVAAALLDSEDRVQEWWP